MISDTTMFHEGLVVADVVYNPEETRFLREAKNMDVSQFQEKECYYGRELHLSNYLQERYAG